MSTAPTITAHLWHDCGCGAAFGLDDRRPATPADLEWWIEELTKHQACPVPKVAPAEAATS